MMKNPQQVVPTDTICSASCQAFSCFCILHVTHSLRHTIIKTHINSYLNQSKLLSFSPSTHVPICIQHLTILFSLLFLALPPFPHLLSLHALRNNYLHISNTVFLYFSPPLDALSLCLKDTLLHQPGVMLRVFSQEIFFELAPYDIIHPFQPQHLSGTPQNPLFRFLYSLGSGNQVLNF